MPYDAFISYSRRADADLAQKLHRALTRFAKPWWRRRALVIFHDDSSLTANPGLWSSIAVAMDECRYFILLACPDATESTWVAREIEHWRETKPAGTILLVLTSGIWVWDDAANTFDWERSTAIPRALDGAFTEQPRYTDLSWVTSPDDLDLRHTRFRGTVTELAAPIRRMSREDLDGEDVRQHRKTRRTATAAGLVLVLLAVVAIIGGLTAVHNATLAQQQAKLATARQLVAQSSIDLDRKLDRGMLAAAESHRIDPIPETVRALTATSQRSAGLSRTFYDNVEILQSAALSPDGKLLVTGAADGSIRLYDTASRTPLGELTRIERDVRDLRFSPDGKLLAAAATDSIHVYDVATRRPAGQVIPDSVANAQLSDTQAHGIAFSPNGALLVAFGGNNTLRYYDTATRTAVTQPDPVGQREVRAAVINDAFVLAAGSDDGTITIRYPQPGRAQRILSGHTDGISGLATVPGTPFLVSASDDGTVRVWDVETGTVVRGPFEGHTGPVTAVSVSPDGTTIATAGKDRTVRLWDLPTSAPLGPPLNGHDNWISAVVLGPDGILASAGWDSTVRLWAVSDRSPMRGVSNIRDMQFSRDGSTLITGSDDGAIRLWDHAAHQVRATLTGHTEPVYALAVSPDGKLLASAGGNPKKEQAGDAAVRLWDLTSGTLLATMTGHTKTVRRLAFSPDGTTLLSGDDDGFLRFWDPRTHEARRTVRTNPAGPIGGVGFLPDGRPVLAAGALLVLDTPEGKPRLLGQLKDYLPGVVGGLAVSADGTIAIGSLTGNLTLWDGLSGKRRAGPVATDQGPIRHLAFTPDGQALVTAGDQGALRFWDAGTAEALGGPVAVHAVRVDGLAFTPDGSELASAGAERLIQMSPAYLWDIDPQRQHVRICDVIGRNLTQAEWNELLSPQPYRRTCDQWPAP